MMLLGKTTTAADSDQTSLSRPCRIAMVSLAGLIVLLVIVVAYGASYVLIHTLHSEGQAGRHAADAAMERVKANPSLARSELDALRQRLGSVDQRRAIVPVVGSCFFEGAEFEFVREWCLYEDNDWPEGTNLLGMIYVFEKGASMPLRHWIARQSLDGEGYEATWTRCGHRIGWDRTLADDPLNAASVSK